MKRHRDLLLRSVPGLLVGCLAVGCGGAASSGSATLPSDPTSSSSTADLSVSSSIASGSVLARPLVWRARVSSGDAVDHVDFVVDGHRRWTEHEAPYEFNEGRPLVPWALGAGRHHLAVRVVTTSGTSAATDATVTVAGEAAAALPTGRYVRTITPADLRRVLPYRDAAHGVVGESLSPERWIMDVQPNGVLVLDRAKADPYDGFYLPYRTSGDRLALYGAAPWLQPHPDDPSIFCEPEPRASYRWSASPDGSLTITPTGHICADRDAAVVGTWRRS